MADLKTYTRVCEECGAVMHNVGSHRKLCDECRRKRDCQRVLKYYHENFSATARKRPGPKTVAERDAEFRAENQRFIESAGSYGKGWLKEYLAAQNKKPAGVGAPTSCGEMDLTVTSPRRITHFRRFDKMNGKNKRRLEQRWDKNQPARLAHIHKAKEADKAMQTHFHTYLYKKGAGSYEAQRFEGEAIEAQAAATHYADQMAHTCDHADVRDAVGKLVYRVTDPRAALAKGAGV